jgi:hypothetical protein
MGGTTISDMQLTCGEQFFQVSVVENSKPDKPIGLMQRSLEGMYFKGFAPVPLAFVKNDVPGKR